MIQPFLYQTKTQKLQDELDAAAGWFARNKLTLNLKKTKVMFFGTNHTLPMTENIEISYNGEVVERVAEFKYLGVMVDPRLTFSKHIQMVKNKTFYKIGVLGRIRPFMNATISLVLYKTQIVPSFDFSNYV